MTYRITLQCNNCYEERIHEIPKGIRVKSYIPKAVCPHCSCLVKNI